MNTQTNLTKTSDAIPSQRTEVSFFATRIEAESRITSAMITALVNNPADASELLFKTKLRNTLSDWVQTTIAGRQAWEQSGEDFNFGDLAGVSAEPELVSRLATAGIHELRVDIIGYARHSWNFDEVLIDDKHDEVLINDKHIEDRSFYKKTGLGLIEYDHQTYYLSEQEYDALADMGAEVAEGMCGNEAVRIILAARSA